MKKYIEPKIKAVELDADQAILQVCSVGGKYFESIILPPSTGICVYGTGGAFMSCSNLYRGKMIAGGGYIQTAAIPS